jgi:hypothetical protein
MLSNKHLAQGLAQPRIAVQLKQYVEISHGGRRLGAYAASLGSLAISSTMSRMMAVRS